MAEVLVSSITTVLLGNLNSQVLEEFAIAWGLTTEIRKMDNTLSTIHAVLHDAEQKQRKDEALKNWLRKLKLAAYDAEDVLDEFNTAALRRKADAERRIKYQVSALFSTRNPLLFRFKMAHKLKSVRESLDAIAEERSKFHLTTDLQVHNTQDRQTASLVNDSEIYGRDEEKKKIIGTMIDDLSDDVDLHVYAIWGMGGMGKTTLAQLVFNDERIEGYFDLRIWVCVSDDFQIARLIKAIIESIDGTVMNISQLDPLQRCLGDKWRGKKFLLVLDDVWNENLDKWNELKELLRNVSTKGSMILVTTRIEKIAIMMATLPIHHIQFLLESDSWSLFRFRAFGKEPENPELEAIGREILKKCDGVPLAVKAMGSLLRLKKTRDEWLSVKRSEMWDFEEKDSGILPALRLSYDNLQPHLKQCFAYCSVFPKDHLFVKDELIQLWMANGFIHCRGRMDLHDFGNDIFDELVWRSFLQDVCNDYRGVTCKMHDLMHDLAYSFTRDECSTSMLGEVPPTTANLLHMYVMRNRLNPISQNKDMKRFHSLRSFISPYFDFQGEYFSFFLKQKYLRALHVYCPRSIPTSIGSLKHMRYLNFSKSGISSLPESTTCLVNLQTLKLRYCSNLQKLPVGMRHMKNLIYLDVKGCYFLKSMPSGLGSLSCLRMLSLYVVGKDIGHRIDELEKLNLGGELNIEKLDNIIYSTGAKNANLIGKQDLRELRLCWEGNQDECNVQTNVEEIIECLQPHQNIEKLEISGYRGSKLPTWMMNLLLPNLVEIWLVGCKNCEHLPPLGKLAFLKVLYLSEMNLVRTLDELFGDGVTTFPRLMSLKIRFMPNLEEWTTTNVNEAFPCLSDLTIEYCPQLVTLPFFPSLDKLELEENNVTLLNLRVLKLIRLVGVKSLSSQLDNLVVIRRLHLQDCSELETLCDGTPNLNTLEVLSIEGCDSLVSFPINQLRGLSSLKELGISDCKTFSSLSEGLQYLTALRVLRLDQCPLLNSLPNTIGCLKSLSLLWISKCENLLALPEDLRSLVALKSLVIAGCPTLEMRCKQGSGEDWPKIAHIPYISFNNELVQDVQRGL